MEVFEQVITYIDKEISCEFELEGDNLACGRSNNQLTVINSGGLAPYTYEWRMVDCDGFITDGADEQTVTFTSGFTTQNFEVLITDADGCTQLCTFTAACIKDPVIDGPEGTILIGPGGQSGGGESGPGGEFTVYPNPAVNSISISLAGNDGRPVIFEVTDLVGRTLLSRKVNSWPEGPYEVNISTLPDGPYFVRLQQENGQSSTKRIMVLKP
jgi:hypothetical protein